MNDFQRRLDDRRDELHMRVSELARRCGLPRSTVHRLLYGPMIQPPKREQLEGLAKGLNWPLEFLQQGALEVVDPDLKLHNHEDQDLQIVASSWPQLSERDRRTILRMVEELRRDRNG